MRLDKRKLRHLIEERHEANRFTQDSPVVPDVWLAFAERRDEPLDLLLTPVEGIDAADLAAELRRALGDADDAWIAYSGAYVVASLTLAQLVHAVLPLADWWGSDREWLATVLGAIEAVRRAEELPVEVSERELLGAGRELLGEDPEPSPPDAASLKLVTRNRTAYRAVARSRQTVKADAVTRLFEVNCSDLAWAVVDSGIDATHPAFRRREEAGRPSEASSEDPDLKHSRVVATYDMTRLRLAQRAVEEQRSAPADPAVARIVADYGGELEKVHTHLLDTRPLDWNLLEPLLRVPHGTGYELPVDDHGTHVAGILAADWPEARKAGADYPLVGICRDLRLYDIRVFPRDAKGEKDTLDGDEFTVAAALQFIDHLNGYGRRIRIAGANLSLSVPYEPSAFGCGQTPVCQEANRLSASGVVVVAAAGNRGREEYVLEEKLVQGYRMIGLTDPGNAEDAITVGSTHATDPHAYGISHFSSKGPSADGRAKPDLVAPGEKIQAPSLGGKAARKDGTSQATPHVSGAAALLLARHRELIGKPQQVKRLLMGSATDLGREHYFQGAGLVDALRAAQAH